MRKRRRLPQRQEVRHFCVNSEGEIEPVDSDKRGAGRRTAVGKKRPRSEREEKEKEEEKEGGGEKSMARSKRQLKAYRCGVRIYA